MMFDVNLRMLYYLEPTDVLFEIAITNVSHGYALLAVKNDLLAHGEWCLYLKQYVQRMLHLMRLKIMG